MRKVDWMADTGAKTQSSDKTNPPSVSGMTLLYVNAESSPGFTLVQHKAKGPRERESVWGRGDAEAEKEARLLQKAIRNKWIDEIKYIWHLKWKKRNWVW